MRADMKHVIIDRPRTGGDGGKSRPPKGSMRRWQRTPAEDYPRSESMARGRRYGCECKHLNEHLAPLRRWLRSNCGRSWNKVYSEICTGLTVRSATSAHVRDHAEAYVLKDTRLIQGVVCDSKGEPINNGSWRWHYQPFYVDPRDGTLRQAPRRKRRQGEPQEPDHVDGKDPLHQYRLLNGVWFEIEFAPYPALEGALVRHVVSASSPPAVSHINGRNVYAKSKRQLGKDEIRKLKLWDTPLGKKAKAEGR